MTIYYPEPSTRIKGTGLVLALALPGDDDGARNVWADVSSCTIFQDGTPTDGFHGPEFNDGEWVMEVEAIQSTDPGSFWMMLWEHPFETVPYIYAPHGNEEPTKKQPHFVGMVNLGNEPSIGGEAGKSVEYSFTTRLTLTGKPTITT